MFDRRPIVLLLALVQGRGVSGWSPLSCHTILTEGSTYQRFESSHGATHRYSFSMRVKSRKNRYWSAIRASPNEALDSSTIIGALPVDTPDLPNLFVPLLAIVLLVASQTFINQMLQGDQGLGAYLKDGRGLGRSSFRPLTLDDKSRAVSDDPLPWLKLPKLDFVDVAGQEEQTDSEDSVEIDEGQDDEYAS